MTEKERVKLSCMHLRAVLCFYFLFDSTPLMSLTSMFEGQYVDRFAPLHVIHVRLVLSIEI